MPSFINKINKKITKKVERAHDKFDHVALTSLLIGIMALEHGAKDHTRKRFDFSVPEASALLFRTWCFWTLERNPQNHRRSDLGSTSI